MLLFIDENIDSRVNLPTSTPSCTVQSYTIPKKIRFSPLWKRNSKHFVFPERKSKPWLQTRSSPRNRSLFLLSNLFLALTHNLPHAKDLAAERSKHIVKKSVPLSEGHRFRFRAKAPTERLRIGYISSNFGNSPVSFLHRVAVSLSDHL